MTPQRALLIQSLLEALIPVYGYFYWNWDVSFILLFYCLDWLLFLGIAIAKARKRLQFAPFANEIIICKQLFIHGIVTLLLTLIITWFLIPMLVVPFSWTERIYSFLTYEEMGVPQGIILIPLVVLNGILLYKQQFIRSKRYENTPVGTLIGEVKIQGWIITGCAFLALIIALVTPFPPQIVIGTTIIGCFIYRVYSRNNL